MTTLKELAEELGLEQQEPDGLVILECYEKTIKRSRRHSYLIQLMLARHDTGDDPIISLQLSGLPNEPHELSYIAEEIELSKLTVIASRIRKDVMDIISENQHEYESIAEEFENAKFVFNRKFLPQWCHKCDRYKKEDCIGFDISIDKKRVPCYKEAEK